MTGELRHYITIEQSSRTADGMGGGAISWASFVSVWSRVEPVSARQRAHGEGLEARVTHKVLMRRDDATGVTIAMRVNFETRILQIHGIKDVGERRRFLELACEEGAPS